MSENIKERLAAGKMVRIFALSQLASPKLIEMVAFHGGYHGFWIDQEHAAISHQQIETLALACRATGLDSYVRLAPTDYATVMRPMEAGIGGIMAAQIRSIEEARQVVSWAKYPPIGVRGLNLSNYEADWASVSADEFIERANRERWLAIQIETREAVEQAEEIARIEGIDHLFIGPMDLSTALGVPGDFLHSKCVSALETVARAAKVAGKSWGILPRSREHALKCRELGCQLFALAGDIVIIHRGIKAVRETYEDFFEEK